MCSVRRPGLGSTPPQPRRRSGAFPHCSMRLTLFAPSRRRALALAVAPIALTLASLVPGASAGAASTGVVPDPTVGPNAMQERLLGASATALAPDSRLPSPQPKPMTVTTRAAVMAQTAPQVAAG